jgi:hypothetical protein
MNRSLLFLTAFFSLTLQLHANERELISEEIFSIKLALDPIVCRNAEWIGGGFRMYFPGEISIGSHLIEDAPPLLEGVADFTFELPDSVACENLQFNEMPRQTSVIRRVYQEQVRGLSHREIVKTTFVSETTITIPVLMNGQNIILMSKKDPWISSVQNNGHPFDTYYIQIHPQAHTISCQPLGLANEGYAITFSKTAGEIWDLISNVNQLKHVFANLAECQEFHSKLLSHYSVEDPDNNGTLVAISRKLETLSSSDPYAAGCYQFEQETSFMTLLGLEFSGVRSSFPLQPCARPCTCGRPRFG